MADSVELKVEVQDVATLQIEPQEIPNIGIEPQYSRNATINGVNALEIITKDGISSEMVGSTFIISGQQLQQEDARLEQLIINSAEQSAVDKEELERKIALEESLRTSADEELQENIDAEAVLRSNADIQLQQNINSEEQARESADNALSGRIDSEESARINADNTLQQNITNEETARINKYNELQQAIATEKTRAENAESELSSAIESEETARTQADSGLQSQITTNASDISTINSKIPTQASSTNQLADKDFVNSSINNVTAFYITKNAAGDPFSTKAELDSTTVFYSGGQVRTLTRNDYCIVLADESKIDPETQEVPTTRYIYQNAWQYQYTVNKTSLTAEQLKAINSGITEEKVSEYDEHIADNTIHVTQNDKNTWNAKQPAGDYATNTSLNNEVNRATQAEEDLGGLIDGLETSKQDVISDLGTIRTGAGLGATAVQPATLNNYVPTTRTINGKALSSNISLNAGDVGAEYSGAVSVHNQSADAHADIRADIEAVDKRIDETLIPKSVNAIIIGEPTITNGQVSGFTQTSYLTLPFLFDVGDRGFEFTYCFRTGEDITTPQNHFGSRYSIASYISGGKLTIRVSSNGTDWDILSLETVLEIVKNSIYYIKIIFNKLNYVIKASTDGVNYNEIARVVNTKPPFAGDITIGIGNNQNNPFKGILYMNAWELKFNNSVYWEGMDDAGLSTRADISLSNLDAEGKAKFNAKQDVIDDLDSIREGAELGSTALQPDALDGYVPTSRTINNKALTANVSLNASDVGALSTSTKYGASLSYLNNSLQLKDQSGGNLGSPVTIKTSGTLNDLTDVVISGQTSGQFLSYNGTKWVNTTFSGLQNTSNGYNGLTILGTPSYAMGAINIGYNSSIDSLGLYGVAIGDYATVNSSSGIAIGNESEVDSSSDYSISIGNGSRSQNKRCVSLGYWAISSAYGAIQIGNGSNFESGSLYVGLSTSDEETNNYKLLGSNGKIPTERLADNGSTGQVLKKTSSGMEWGTAGVSVSYDSTNERLIFG